MTIYRSSGKNTEIYEEYELYTREYIENVQGKSSFTAKGGTTYGNKPETAKPLEITNLYVKVRLNDDYNGEFGFDWVDVNPETKEIEKIQGVPFSEVEYFYKKGATPTDLGDIVAKSGDEMGAKHAIQDHYKFNSISKYVDIPYVLIKPNQEITLSAEVILSQGVINEDVIAITGDEFYEFEIIGGEKEGKTSKKKLTEAGKIDFKVKCLQAGTDKTYEFKHSSPMSGSHPVGGINMMENKVLKLKFRVIALVSSDDNPNEKAKVLFRKFKDNDIKKYLNENSLNQSGYEVEIENQAMFDGLETVDLDDYFYAFDKADWTTKNYYNLEERERPKLDPNGYGTKKPDGTWEMEKYYAKTVFEDIEVDSGKKNKENKPIMNTKSVDSVTTEEYIKKLKGKTKFYSGGLIILVDGECKEKGTGAFSRTSPLDHYALVVYSKNTGAKDTYSHEIGHMLGLPHLFFDLKEKESYKIARENILGNGSSDNIGIKKRIDNIKNDKGLHYGYKRIIAIKSSIISKLENYNNSRLGEITKEKKERDAKKAYYINYKDSDKVGVTQTKKEYFDIWNSNIKKIEDYVEDNKKAILDLKNRPGNNYETTELQKWFIRTDLISLLNEEFEYYKMLINQVHSNYIIFKQGTTKNMMDYHNKREFFLSNQINIMRSDMQNYIDISIPKSTAKK